MSVQEEVSTTSGLTSALRTWRSVSVVALLCITSVGGAQESDRRTREIDALAWRGEFTSVDAALSAGRKIVVIDGDQILRLALTGDAELVLREGDGPLELRSPRRLFAFRGDSMLVAGKDESILMVLSPDGAPVRRVSVGSLSTGTNWLRTLRGVASDGKLLYVSPRVTNPRVDSAGLLLVNPERKSVAVVATISYPSPGGTRDQAVLLPSGNLVVFRAGAQALEVIDPEGRRLQTVALPAQTRVLTAAERARATSVAENAKTRVDSMVQRMEPKVRGVVREAAYGALLRTTAATVPAYAENSLIALSRDIVALARVPGPRQTDRVYDWYDVQSGRMGQFTLSGRYRIVGSSARGVALARFTEPDDFLQVAVLTLQSLLTP